MRKLFKEHEFDKISMELLNKIYPMESLNSYYSFGMASALSTMTDIANQYINKGYGDKLDADDLKKLIREYISQSTDVKEMYERLRKDGIKNERGML